MRSRQTVVEVNAAELIAIIEKTKQAPLSVEDYEKLKVAGATVIFLQEEIKKKKASISRLRAILFGAGTEKTSRILGGSKAGAKAGANRSENKSDKTKPAGHGRNGAAAYTGADRVRTAHPTLHGGDHCPCCTRGSVYPMADPEVLVRITGMAPLNATVYEDERLRCNLCGEVFTAPAPAEAGDKKYDETATAMIGELKYGVGLPFNRIEKLQAGMGIPLPATTQ